MKSRETVYLIDGSSYIFRAYFAIQRLSTSKGFPTNAIFGFTNMLLKVIEERKPRLLGIAFDTGRATFRKELYSEYKSNREAAPEDLVPQFPHIRRAAEAVGLRPLAVEGIEADDIIATLARKAVEEGYEVEIISGDKDLMQLVGDHVTLYDPMTDKRYDVAAVKEKFGVEPGQIVDYLALMGDASDNIPGVAGIGKKTAADLIAQFGSLDALYGRLDEIKSEKRRETLLRERDSAYLSRSLTQLKYDVDLGLGWKDLEYKGLREDQLESFLREFEFNNLLKRLGKGGAAAPKPVADKAQVVILRDADALRAAVEELRRAPAVAVDTETTSLHTQDAEMVGISLCGSETKAYYLPVGHVVDGGDLLRDNQQGQMDADEARAILKPFLEDPGIPKVGQNLKYDVQVFRRWGVDLRGVSSDTMLASYLLDPDEPHNLDSLSGKYLGRPTITYEEVTGRGKSQKSFAEVEIGRAAEYSGEDSEVALKLHGLFLPRLKEQGLERLYREVEVPLVCVLADMEFIGVSVDRRALQKMSEDLEAELKEEESKVYSLAGETFNINSPKQLAKILFEKLKLPVLKRTKTGISTDESVLAKLCQHHEICNRILAFRGLGKLRSTYVEGLLAQIHGRTGRIHTSYNQTIAATGRLSSSNPNLQNIPVPGETKYDIRSVFVAEPGWEFLSADYSQVELRLLADMSGDPELVRAFRNDEDVHEFTGRLIFGTEKVSPEQRRIAKTINFGVVYGQTPFGLSQTLGISTGKAKEFIDTYFQRYGKVKAYLGGVMEAARREGFVTTKLGRRRYVREIRSANRVLREMAERVAINTPLQGSAADMIKVAMVSLHSRLRKEGLRSRMVLQVHDELVFEVPSDEKKVMEALVREEMERAMPLSVPLRVDMGWGTDWSACG